MVSTGTVRTWTAPDWVVVHVHAMAPMFLIAWLIFKRERGDVLYLNLHKSTNMIVVLTRQMNMDYAIVHALNYNQGSSLALVIYDICCQWSIHFKERMSKYQFLSLWDDVEIVPAVGKFHLGAHVKECFYKFSLNFIKGSAQVDGEIMETLWSVLDKVSGITRSMSKHHRQEILDDHMNDGNWKKLVKSGSYIQQVHRLED